MGNIFGIFGRNDKKEQNNDKSNKKIVIDARRCPQNHPCPSVRVCPVGALSQEGYAVPVVDMEKCIVCGKCVNYCPMRAIIFR